MLTSTPGANLVTATLSVPSGTLTLGSANLLLVNRNGTSSVDATGMLVDLNAGLQGLTFTPAAGTSGPIGLTITTNDNENTSAGGPLSDTDQITINVALPPTLSINDVAALEGDSGTKTFSFTVTLSAASTLPVTVNFATTNGTATAGSDYQSASGLLTFASGTTTQTVIVQVNGDTTVEPDETFFVDLTTPTNATIVRSRGTGTITNDDAVAVIQFSISSLTVEDTAGSLSITLTNPSELPGSVGFTTQDGTAQPAWTTCRRLAPSHSRAAKRQGRSQSGSCRARALWARRERPCVSVVLGNPSSGAVIGTPSVLTVNVQHPAGPPVGTSPAPPPPPAAPQPPDDPPSNAPRRERRGEPPRLTVQQRQEDQMTNRSSNSDVHTEGNVIAVEKAADGKSLLVSIALVRNERLVVQVPCFGDGTCYDIQAGDYLEVDGYQNGVGDPNDWFVASDGVTTWRGGHRVR